MKFFKKTKCVHVERLQGNTLHTAVEATLAKLLRLRLHLLHLKYVGEAKLATQKL